MPWGQALNRDGLQAPRVTIHVLTPSPVRFRYRLAFGHDDVAGEGGEVENGAAVAVDAAERLLPA